MKHFLSFCLRSFFALGFIAVVTGCGGGGSSAPLGSNIPPAMPANLSVTLGANQALLSWGSVPNSNGYNVYREVVSGSSSAGLSYTKIASVTATNYTDTLTSAQYYVTAFNNYGESVDSNIVAVSYSPSFGWQVIGREVTVASPATAYTFTTSGNNVLVSMSTGSEQNTAATIPVADYAFGAALSPDGKRIYKTTGDGNVSVIDTPSGTVLAVVSVATGPADMKVSSTGSALYTDGNVQVDGTNIPVGSVGYGIALNPDGSRLFVALGNPTAGVVSVVDTAAYTVIAEFLWHQ